MAQTTVSLSQADLEALVRRVVREELTRLTRERSVSADARHEGPDDPAQDDALLADALAVLEAYGDDSSEWSSWEDVKAELASAEAAGELPR